MTREIPIYLKDAICGKTAGEGNYSFLTLTEWREIAEYAYARDLNKKGGNRSLHWTYKSHGYALLLNDLLLTVDDFGPGGRFESSPHRLSSDFHLFPKISGTLAAKARLVRLANDLSVRLQTENT